MRNDKRPLQMPLLKFLAGTSFRIRRRFMRSSTSNNARAVLDCSRPSPWFFWFVVGAGFALMAMNGQGAENLGSLLRVGTDNPAFARIESELGPIVSPDPMGHDGQLYYMIARDPFG